MSLALALRVALLLGATAAIAQAMRSCRPASRHALWHAAVVAALAMPVASLLSPSWAVFTAPSPAAEARGLVVAPANRVPLLPADISATSVWMAGSGLVALYFMAGAARLWRLRRRARPAPAGWTTAVARLSARFRLTRAIDVVVSADVRGPLVTGVGRATVILPDDAGLWSADRREAVLIHELAHVSRGDLTAQLAAQALVSVHWFNPMAWYALREMRREREGACDEAVIGAGVDPLSYATELLALACAGSGRRVPGPALSMARVSELEGRLTAVLAHRVRRREPSRATGVAIAVLVASIGATISGAQFRPHTGPVAAQASPNRAAGWTMLQDATAAAGAEAEFPAWSGHGGTRERDTRRLGMTPGDEVIGPLLEALVDPSARVREQAALGLTWRRDKRIAPALVAAAADPSPAVREKALVALAFSGESRAAAVIEAAREDPDARVREKAKELGARN